MRILRVDKTFKGEPYIERHVMRGAGEFECHEAAHQVPETPWRAAHGVRTFGASPFVNSMADKLDNCRIVVRGGFDGDRDWTAEDSYTIHFRTVDGCDRTAPQEKWPWMDPPTTSRLVTGRRTSCCPARTGRS